MSCIRCKRNTETVISSADCVEAALEALHRHFAEYRKVDIERQQELACVQDQNAKLKRIITLLQKQQKGQQLMPENNVNLQSNDQPSNCSNENLNTTTYIVDVETPSKLDTAALDCGNEIELLSSSPLMQSPQSNADIIAESEIAHNVRAKRIARKKQEMSTLNSKPKSPSPLKELNSNNAEYMPYEIDRPLQWVSKLPIPKANADSKIKKPFSLSLRKKDNNLKQTKLPFETTRSEEDYEQKVNLTVRKDLAPSKSALLWILSGNRNTEASHLDLKDQNDNNETLLIPCTSKSVILIPPESPELIFLDETCNNLANTNLNSTNEGPIYEAKRIKTEKDVDVEELHRKAQELFGQESENMIPTDSEDSFIVHPIITKEEPLTPTKNIKQRFKIECPDCEEFFANNHRNMSDDEIRMHLQNCKHYRHKHQTRLTQTPEGFWDPMITSFDKDDPRNEVFIDNRFKNVKRNIN